MINRTSLSSEGMTEAIADGTLYVQGKRTLPPGGMEIADQAAALMEAAVGEMKEAGGDIAKRLQAMYKYAVARDAANALSSRYFVKALAHHNNMRGAYQGAVIALVVEGGEG